MFVKDYTFLIIIQSFFKVGLLDDIAVAIALLRNFFSRFSKPKPTSKAKTKGKPKTKGKAKTKAKTKKKEKKNKK